MTTCPTCGAGEGAPCRTPSGREAAIPHSRRLLLYRPASAPAPMSDATRAGGELVSGFVRELADWLAAPERKP